MRSIFVLSLVLVSCIAILFFSVKEDLAYSETGSSNLSCPMFKCNIYRTGNVDFDPGKNGIDFGMETRGSNAPEHAERKFIKKTDAFDSSPLFVDLDLDGNDEVITFYKNTIYNITLKSRTFTEFIMAVKYKENLTELEKLEFGEGYLLLWKFDLPAETHTSFSVGDFDADGHPEIAFGCDDGNLYVLTSEGNLLFKFKTQAEVRSTPAIVDLEGDSKQEVVFGSNDGNLYVLDAEGNLKWKFSAGGEVVSSPTVSGDYVSFGSDDSYLYILSRENSTLHCKFKTRGAVRSSPLHYKHRLFFGSDDGYIYELSEDCSLINAYETSGRVRGSPAVFGDYVVVGSEDGYLYYLGESGLRSIFLGSPIYSTPCSAEDWHLVSVSEGRVYAINLTSKEIRWENLLAREFSCSPSIGNGGLFSCFYLPYEENDEYAGFFIAVR